MTILFGEVKCGQCGTENVNPQMMDMDDEGTETLIYCDHCQKWVKWF